MFKIFIFFLIIGINLSYAQTNYFTSFDGTKIAYTDQGKGKPILLLHGFINSRKSWDKAALKKDLLEKGHRLIIPDLRGNGESDKPQKDADYIHNAEIRDIILLMDSLKIKRYKTVGYSRGSIVLAELLTKDKRITKAVLGGMGIDFTNPSWNRRIMFMNAFAGDINEETQGAVNYAKSINADFRSLHLQQKHQPATGVGELSKVNCKILVIAGDKDLDNGSPKELKKVFAKGDLKIVSGDHNGTYKTKEFSKAILSFL